MTAYYNEIEPYAAKWLQNLIDAGLIAPGVVDTRSIEDVTPNDLKGFTQCHFFAGIGIFSYALRLAGWPDNRPVWTGSCPCQPFSQAGKGAGVDDERHLWPAFHWLIQQCRPAAVFGEQVASKDGLAWLDIVQADLEGTGYTSAALDLCAASVGAPHIRQRLYWMAHANGQPAGAGLPAGQRDQSSHGRSIGGLEHPGGDGRQGWLFGWTDPKREAVDRQAGCNRAAGATLQVNGFWRDADWIYCRDGVWRPVEPGTFPLANGVAGRVGRCRAYGNGIVAPLAQAFIEAAEQAILECRPLVAEAIQ